MIKAVIAALLLCVSTIAFSAELPEIRLTIGKSSVTAEVANTETQRATGLMNRRMLPEDRGMLFVFPEIALHAMWMMNTYVPLSVAFMDRDGVIINIEDMQPQTQDTHPAVRPARYALEVNLGWFRKRGIKPGDKVDGLEKAAPAR